MSLWGIYDVVPQTNTAIATVAVTAANSTVIGVNTKFADDFSVGQFVHVGKNDYVIEAISNNDTMTVRSGIAGGSLVGAAANASYVVSEKPKYVVYSEVGGDANTIYGVSTAEMAYANTADTEADNVTHAGWVERTVGTGGRSGRVFYETLVAGSMITGDDDTSDDRLPE